MNQKDIMSLNNYTFVIIQKYFTKDFYEEKSLNFI